MNNLFIFLMQQPNAEGGSQGGIMSFLPFILLIGVVYLFFIRPQMKRTKEQKKFRESIKKNQQIITIGGIHGKIVEIGDAWVIIEVEDKSRLKIDKSAISIGTISKEEIEK